ARRSIYTTVDIHKGAKISPEMLKLVRHAYGLEPRDLNEVVGMTVTRDLRKDMPLHREDICR
ncbi:MAG TPA: SAF domain-containing protein, partial [Thermodesulfobacteriota bacterium]|nr:SAF domain-containing protein [Thermodesulfobacteriota bacterium]